MLKQTIYLKTRDRLAYHMDLIRTVYFRNDVTTHTKLDIINDYYQRCIGLIEFGFSSLSIMDGDQYEYLMTKVRRFVWHYIRKLYGSEVN